MSLTTLAASAAGFILKAIGKTKVAEKAKDQLTEKLDRELDGLWSWIKPVFSNKNEEKLLEKVSSEPEKEKTRAILEFKLEEMMEEDPDLKNTIEEKVEKIKAIEQQIINISGTNISDAGIVSLGGNVHIEGKNVAGHDMTIHINDDDD